MRVSASVVNKTGPPTVEGETETSGSRGFIVGRDIIILRDGATTREEKITRRRRGRDPTRTARSPLRLDVLDRGVVRGRPQEFHRGVSALQNNTKNHTEITKKKKTRRAAEADMIFYYLFQI